MSEKTLVVTRAEAAALCGLIPPGFDAWARKGVVPGPIPRTRRWSRAALERALGGEVAPVADENDPDAVLERWLRDNPQK